MLDCVFALCIEWLMMRKNACLLACLCLGFCSKAWADADPPAGSPSPAAAPPATAAPATPATEAHDGFRFRHGIAATAGEEFGSGPSSGLSGALFGLDWRLGAQVNNLYAVYFQTHLSFGTAHIGAASGVTGNFAEAVMLERTLVDKYFVGGGAGYGVLNNPSGPIVALRGGLYPLMKVSETEARRRGLMVGADLRFYFAGANVGTVTQVMVSVGYEKY